MAKPSFWTWNWYHRFFRFFCFFLCDSQPSQCFVANNDANSNHQFFTRHFFSFPCQSQPSESLPSDSEQVFTCFFPAPLLVLNILPQHGIPFAFCFWSNRVWDASFHQCPVRINPTCVHTHLTSPTNPFPEAKLALTVVALPEQEVMLAC